MLLLLIGVGTVILRLLLLLPLLCGAQLRGGWRPPPPWLMWLGPGSRSCGRRRRRQWLRLPLGAPGLLLLPLLLTPHDFPCRYYCQSL